MSDDKFIVERHGVEVDLSYEHSTVCPRCAKNGRDTSGDNFHVYGLDKNGKYLGGHCFCCEYTIPSEEWLEENGEVEDVVGKEFNDAVRNDIKASTGVDSKGFRGIRKETSVFFGVRYEYDDDGSVKTVYYPTTKNAVLSGYKLRVVPKSFPSPFGETGKDCDMFGQFRFKTHNGICLIVGGECYSDDTEVLTDKGWKLFSDILDTDLLMQVEQGVGSFVTPLRLIKKEYSGKMISFSCQNTIDLLVTPNHKMVGVNNRGEDFYFQADEKVSKVNHFRKAITFNGKGVNLSDDQIRFIIALSADAKIDTRVSGKKVAHFGFIKERKIERLKTILDNLSLTYSEYDKASRGINVTGKKYHSFNVTLPEWATKKGIPSEWVNDLNQQQRVLFLNEIPLWDGNFCTGRDAIEFNSKHLSEVEIVSNIALLNNQHTFIRKRKNKLGEWYVVKISGKKHLSSFQTVDIKDDYYKGFVYCATVPSGQLLVRRNGKVVVCGNSDQMAAYQMLSDMQKDKKYDSISVVSPLIGESGAYKQVQNNYAFFDQFKKIIVCMDNDEAGKAAAEKVINVLPRGKVSIMKMRRKDPNSYIWDNATGTKLNFEQEFINDFWAAKPFTPAGVKSAADGIDEIADELRKPRITLPQYMHKMQDMMGGGIIQGRIGNIIADTSSGKTTHVNRMVYHWIFNSPITPTIVSLEATASQYMLEMLSVHMEVNLLWKMTTEELLDYLETDEGKRVCNELAYKPNGEPRFFIIDDRAGSIKDMEKELEMLCKKFDSKLFVIDVLTDMLRGSNEEHSEDHMNFQRNMAKNGVTIINVLHTRKPPQSPDGKIRKVTEYDALGTGSFVQSAHYNIVLNRNKLSDNVLEKNTTDVDLPKCRGGKTGQAGKWYYEFDKSKCHDLDDWLTIHPEMATQ